LLVQPLSDKSVSYVACGGSFTLALGQILKNHDSEDHEFSRENFIAEKNSCSKRSDRPYSANGPY
jgi:hypothetical protein